MSSKFANSSRRQWSLISWLTVWYTAMSVLLVGATTCYSYFILISYLQHEDEDFLSSRLNDVETRLAKNPDGLNELASAWRDDSSTDFSSLTIVIRVLGSDGVGMALMQGSDRVPWPSNSAIQNTPEMKKETGGWRFMSRQAKLPSGSEIIIQAALDRRQELTFLARYRKQLYFMLFVAAVACAVGGIVIVRRGLRPLRELSDLAASIGASHMQLRLDSTLYASELKSVATTFNSMLDRLQMSFDRLNRFSGDIAHELRTPLNNMRGEIEVTLTKNRNVVEYEDVLGSCLEECSRMSRLVDSLLFLARADQPESCLKLEKLRLRDELAMIQDFYEVAAEDGKVTLTATSPDLEIVADRTFFQRVIGNLITNAISHTPKGGTIDLHAEAISNEIRVVVKDSGNGISANELPLVFDRLYSGSRTHNGSRGHGLGLSIVKTIVELHGGSVCITSSEGSGTTVETIWPIDMALKCHSQD